MSTSSARPRRNGVPSAKIADRDNGEVPSALHQQTLDIKPILDVIKTIAKLTSQLPETVPEASDDDKIYRVITTLEGIDDSVAGTFNRRFDALFGNNERDANVSAHLVQMRHSSTT
ncbi:hypothetical protein B0H15DRAFT_934227 [Mycena belliarum]|uniref:Uncharacterized protein n=1 Tax=Mycena belliarum TaxID=1033014 RepID=A0AAD6TR62_9AGAR|nr:hypothetical protein B0H15DRAFT_934227 [Mycena belliae]